MNVTIKEISRKIRKMLFLIFCFKIKSKRKPGNIIKIQEFLKYKNINV